MKRAARRNLSVVGAAAVLLGLAALPRLIAITWGLPQVFNADAPHEVDMAVCLAESLRPFSFKNPTFWPTVLAACYGAWFVVWSGFGFLRGAVDFAAKYVFEPSGFHLIARLLATLAQLAAFVVVARVERGSGDGRWPYGAALLAVSPVLVELAHSSKSDSLMLFLVAGATATALRFQSGGGKAWLMGSAALAGLACSTRYTAAPAGLVVPLAWLLRAEGPAPFSWLIWAGLVSAAGFALGTPYALIEHARFAADWSDYGDLGRLKSHNAAATARMVLKNLWCFGGEGSLGGAAAIIGVLALARKQAKRALLLLIPVGVYAALRFEGGASRYLLGAYPALALLAGEGFTLLAGASPWRRGLVAMLALGPGLYLSWHYDAELLRPDTRTQATAWLRETVPAGAVILLDQPHTGAMAVPSKAQCLELAERMEKLGLPHARLYRAMAAKHPGGGWRIYRIQRTSQAEGEFLDVRPGLDLVRAARVEWVVTTSYGADPHR
ncbi:MAG: hypothetical protein AAB262_08115, partial [Elusimicrobiota bacterium]